MALTLEPSIMPCDLKQHRHRHASNFGEATRAMACSRIGLSCNTYSYITNVCHYCSN